MRLFAVLALIPIALVAWVVLVTNGPLRPPPAADRLAGVAVSLRGFQLEGSGDDRRLRLYLQVTSPRAVDECLGFALDAPFRSRRLHADPEGCLRPVAGGRDVEVVLDALTEDDERFPGHTLVWGIPGGRCGPLLELAGVCVVDQAGTLDVELPRPSGLPEYPFGSFPLGSFPLGSFPLFSFPAFSPEP